MISYRFTDMFRLNLLENEIVEGLRLNELITLCCIEPNYTHTNKMKLAILIQEEYETKQKKNKEMLDEKYEYMIEFYNKIDIVKKDIVKKDIVFKDEIKWYQEMKYHFAEKRKKWYQDMTTYFLHSMQKQHKSFISFFISKWKELYPENIGKESQLESEIMLSDIAMKNINNENSNNHSNIERYNHMMSIKISPHNILYASDHEYNFFLKKC
jgi:hypothetical protein